MSGQTARSEVVREEIAPLAAVRCLTARIDALKSHCAGGFHADDEGMKHLFAIGPWLMELINPPPRDSLSLWQKGFRAILVTVTIVTLCVILALVVSLGFFAWQRSSEFLEGAPQVRNCLLILVASALVNAACIYTLLQIKRLDEKLVPRPPTGIEVALPPRDPLKTTPR